MPCPPDYICVTPRFGGLHLIELTATNVLSLVLCPTDVACIGAARRGPAEPLRELPLLPLFLRSVQLRRLPHQEDAGPGFLYIGEPSTLTGVEWVLLDLGQPRLGDDDALLLCVVVGDRVAGLVGLGDDVLHVLVPQRAQQPEEELALRQPP